MSSLTDTTMDEMNKAAVLMYDDDYDFHQYLPNYPKHALYWWKLTFLNLYFVYWRLEITFDSHFDYLKIQNIKITTWVKDSKGNGYLGWISPWRMIAYMFDWNFRLKTCEAKNPKELFENDWEKYKAWDKRFYHVVYVHLVKWFWYNWKFSKKERSV